MKVEKINNNYVLHQGNRQKKVPNFEGNTISIAEEITNLLPGKKALKRMQSFEWLKGEIGGILITAIGTGLVAPIFIGFNPFVKAPKGATKEQKEEVTNTKLYTAMRQPISAVLAILFQVGALKPIDKVLDKVFNNPAYSKNLSINVDQSALNSKSYLKTITKQELTKEGLKKPTILAGFKEGFDKVNKRRKEYDEILKTRINQKAEEQLQKLADTFEQTGRIKIGERNLDNKVVAELINKQIDGYISDANKLKLGNSGLELNAQMAQTNSTSLRDAELDKIITKLKLNKIDDTEKATVTTIQETIKKLVDNCKFDTENKLLNSILQDTDTFDTNAEKLTKKVCKDVTKLYKKFLENNYKAPNQIIKIIIGVCITLPITCNALNWVYPRLMEIVFPRLAGVKKDGGDK